ncbi:Mu transposase domain-containing protein, partial [Rhizobium mesoamericanum]|uniref:Mu transposase domain-containing protein n=1 Tax=Rhizobium mesoamericanum TaxID=1079800 RepID=UPI003CC6E65F
MKTTSSPSGLWPVSTDYHVEFKTFLYSLPHSLIRQQVDLRATARTIEIFRRGKRVAVHQTQDQSEKWPASNRNGGRNEIGMTGRLHRNMQSVRFNAIRQTAASSVFHSRGKCGFGPKRNSQQTAQ